MSQGPRTQVRRGDGWSCRRRAPTTMRRGAVLIYGSLRVRGAAWARRAWSGAGGRSRLTGERHPTRPTRPRRAMPTRGPTARRRADQRHARSSDHLSGAHGQRWPAARPRPPQMRPARSAEVRAEGPAGDGVAGLVPGCVEAAAKPGTNQQVPHLRDDGRGGAGDVESQNGSGYAAAAAFCLLTRLPHAQPPFCLRKGGSPSFAVRRTGSYWISGFRNMVSSPVLKMRVPSREAGNSPIGGSGDRPGCSCPTGSCR
jgi:hypothetical protein